MNQILVMLTTAVLFVFAVTAEARSEPVALQSSVELGGEHVRLGDLFAGLDADAAAQTVARAPAPGHSVTLPTASECSGDDASELVARVAAVYGVAWQPGRTDAPVTLTRRSAADQQALQSELAASLSQAIATRQTELPARSQSTSDQPSASVAAATPRAEPATVAVPVLIRRLGRSEVIDTGDLTWMEIPDDHRAAQYITAEADLIGLAPARGLSPFRPIRLGEVAPPMEVDRGDMVTMRLTAGGLSITARGRALDAGSRGSVIRVLNVDSAQTIDAVVLGPGTVAVLAAGQAPGTAVASLS